MQLADNSSNNVKSVFRTPGVVVSFNPQLNSEACNCYSTEDCRLLGTKIATKSAHAQKFQFKIPSKFRACADFVAIFVPSNLQSSVQCFASWSMCKVEMALINISSSN